jgi:hypothetical protein
MVANLSKVGNHFKKGIVEISKLPRLGGAKRVNNIL